MEFLIFAIIAFIVFIAAVISGMKEVEKKQTKGKENTSSQKQENSFTDIDSLDWDGFYERCRKAEEEREKAGLSYQHIFFVVAGTTKSPWIKTALAPISLNRQLVISQF